MICLFIKYCRRKAISILDVDWPIKTVYTRFIAEVYILRIYPLFWKNNKKKTWFYVSINITLVHVLVHFFLRPCHCKSLQSGSLVLEDVIFEEQRHFYSIKKKYKMWSHAKKKKYLKYFENLKKKDPKSPV